MASNTSNSPSPLCALQRGCALYQPAGLIDHPTRPLGFNLTTLSPAPACAEIENAWPGPAKMPFLINGKHKFLPLAASGLWS